MSEESNELKPDAVKKEAPVSILDIEAGESVKPEAAKVEEPQPQPTKAPETEKAQEAGPDRDPADEVGGTKGPKADGAKRAGPEAENAGPAGGPADGKTKSAGGDEGKTTDGKDAGGKADKDKAGKSADDKGKDAGPDSFGILDKALKDVKFGYKQMPDGPERERNHKLMTLAEQAFIVSGLEDPKRAEDIWQKHTKKPPSPDLMKRLGEAKENGVKGAPNLSGDLAVIENQSLLAAKQTRLAVMTSQIGEWEVSAGDARNRSLEHGRKAQDQLVTPEKADDAGLYLLKSFAMGVRASRDIKLFMAERKRAVDKDKEIKDHNQQIGQLAVETKAFEISVAKLEGREMPNTMGVAGKAVNSAIKRGVPGVFKSAGSGIVNAVADQMKKATMSASIVIDATVGARKPNPQTTFAMFQQSQMGGMGR